MALVYVVLKIKCLTPALSKAEGVMNKVKMMKTIHLLFIIFLPFTLFSETGDSVKTKKLQIGITYSPDYSYRKLKSDASGKLIADMRDTMEIGKYGFTTGVNIVYLITKKISIASGLLLSDKGERTKKYALGNAASGVLPVNNRFIYHYMYLDIPIKANYYILTGKLKLFVTAGMSANIFLTQKTTSILDYNSRSSEKKTSTVESDFSKINLAYTAGLGIDYPISTKMNFKLEPVYRRSITSVINAPVKSYLYSVGLNVGLYYQF
jgi:Outer membrane protein beta-barrel domain